MCRLCGSVAPKGSTAACQRCSRTKACVCSAKMLSRINSFLFKSFSFPRSAWELMSGRSAARLSAWWRLPATRSVATLRSHAPRGNENLEPARSASKGCRRWLFGLVSKTLSCCYNTSFPVRRYGMQRPVATPVTALDDPSLYFNRELSWLEFNRRVLEEAQDLSVPLLERLKFLAIFESNLDEFFMVRVGGLQQKVQSGIAYGSGADRMPVKEQLERIGQTVREMTDQTYHCLMEEVLPALEREGILLLAPKDLTEAHRKHLAKLFHDEVFPVLTPLAVDPGHPFPHLLNKSLNLAVILQRPSQDEELFAVVQVPAVLPRFVPLPGDKGNVFTTLETVIRMHLPELFPGMTIRHATVF